MLTDVPELTQAGRLAVDVDLRLATVWMLGLEPSTHLADALGRDETLRTTVGAMLRAAYFQGYSDALREDREGRRAELHRTHGYRPE